MPAPTASSPFPTPPSPPLSQQPPVPDALSRIGLIVPSSNTTMETEIPELMRRLAPPGRALSFHSARVRMKHVQRDELVAMNGRARQAMTELMDAPIDAVAYACLVAIMAMGHGHHRVAADEMTEAAQAAGRYPAVITSAGALVEGLSAAGAKRIALVMPYADELARSVAEYLEAEGLQVAAYENLRVTDNTEVGRIPGEAVLDALGRLDLAGVDHVVLSACVQMPSLAILDAARERTGLPVTSAAECTAKALLKAVAA